MPRSKSRGKKPNHHKRVKNMAPNTLIWMKESTPRNIEGRIQYESNLSFGQTQALIQYPLEWLVRVWVEVTPPVGDKYQEEAFIFIEQDEALAEIDFKYQEARDDLKLHVDPEHKDYITDAGWIARPMSPRLKARYKKLSEEVA